MVSVSNNAMVAGIVGLVTVAVGLSRNKFLQTNALEMVHRFVHLLTGDRYENMRAAVERDPWFGKENGVAVVTGSNAGMGYETALGLARTGCRVILAVRTKKKGEEAAEKIQAATGNSRVEVMELDMDSVASVRKFAQALVSRKLPLHVLVHNAGASGKEARLNADGLEATMALNYLNVVLLTSLLLPVIKSSAPSRVVIVGSSAHFVGARDVSLCFGDRASPPISGWDLYGSSKLNVVAYSKLLAKKLASSDRPGITVVSLDPGFVASGFYSKPVPFPVSLFGMVANLVAKSPATGAHSSLFAALAPHPPRTGMYIADTLESASSALACDETFQLELIEGTLKKIKGAASWWDEAQWC